MSAVPRDASARREMQDSQVVRTSRRRIRRPIRLSNATLCADFYGAYGWHFGLIALGESRYPTMRGLRVGTGASDPSYGVVSRGVHERDGGAGRHSAAGRRRSGADSTPLLASELKVVEQGINPNGVDVRIRR